MTAVPPERSATPSQLVDEWTIMLGRAAGAATGRQQWQQHSNYSGRVVYSTLLASGTSSALAWNHHDRTTDSTHTVLSFDARMALWNLARGGFERASERAAMEAIFEAQLRMMAQPDVARDRSVVATGADLAVAEGVVELVVRERTDAFLDEVGVTARVPGIRSGFGPPSPRPNSHYAAAVDVLLADIDENTRGGTKPLHRDELLNDLLREDPRQAVRTLATRVVDSALVGREDPDTGRLVDGVIRPTDLQGRQEAIDRVARAVDGQLAGLAVDGRPGGTAEQLQQQGSAAGVAAAGALGHEVIAIYEERRPPTPREVVDQVLQQQGQAATDVTFAHHSSFNGVTEPASEGQPSISRWDGSQQFDQASVLDPLMRLAENDGRQQSTEALIEQKRAVQLMFEQNLKMLSGPGREYGEAAVIYGTPDASGAQRQPDRASIALSMGNAADVANDPDALNAYIDKLGLERYAPGLRAVTPPPNDSTRVIAAHEFAHGLGEAVGMPGREMAIRLSTVDPERQFTTAARHLLQKHGLDTMITDPTQRAAATAEIADAMKQHYAGVEGLEGAHPEGQRIAAVTIGRYSALQGDAKARDLVQRYGADPELGKVQAVALGGTQEAAYAPGHSAPETSTTGERPASTRGRPAEQNRPDGRTT
jgi:hypothetical protein